MINCTYEIYLIHTNISQTGINGSKSVCAPTFKEPLRKRCECDTLKLRMCATLDSTSGCWIHITGL